MIPREHLGTAEVPGGEKLQLYRRGNDFTIMADRAELMGSRMSGSEEALARLTAERMRAATSPRWLIGGYGMGFTLRAALAVLPPDALITIAELVPGILDWARGPMAELTAGCLDDARVLLRVGDVIDAIAGSRAGFDAILLDVDNGPDGLTRANNEWLYMPKGLLAAKAALKPGGILAVWSAAPDPSFNKRLAAAGFDVEEVAVRARANGKGPRHVIWFARNDSDGLNK